ncbi:MAG: putative sulfate exporter family transporter [Steroidobacteraceae bacterium]
MIAALPGLAFAVALALAAKLLYYATGSAVSPVLCAIVLGILWRNTAGIGGWAEPGLEFAGRTLLRIGIALIGLRLTLLVLADVSVAALPVVLASVTAALVAALGLGRLLGVGNGMRTLLAVGTAICGCTAIIAVAPSINARKAEIGIALTCVVVFGSIAMMAYPWLAAAVFGYEALPVGMFLGASIHDTSQVVGASLIYAEHYGVPDTVAIAGLTKFLRTLGLLVLVPAAGWWAARGAAASVTGATHGIARRAVPAFVLFFVGFVILRTIGDYYAADGMPAWQALLELAQVTSEWLLLIGMAAVGLGVTFSHLREAGWRPIALSFLAALATGATALGMVQLLT